MSKDKELLAVHSFLTTEKELLSGVFEMSQSLNLRLLRYAMLEFARVFDRIPVDLKQNQDGMRHLLATFAALSISFHGGDGIGFEGLGQENGWARALWQVNGEKGTTPPKTSLEILQERFGEHLYVKLYGQVLSAELATAWIAKGHVADDFLSRELRKSAVFKTQDSEAWQTLWWWERRACVDVEAALETVKQQFVDNEFRDPAVIMHLAGIMLALSDGQIGWTSRETVVQELCMYLAVLEGKNLLPEDFPKRLCGNFRFDSGAFGLSFKQQKSKEFHAVRDKLFEALDRSFWRLNSKRAKDLLALAKSDAKGFVDAISDDCRRDGIPNYAGEPIFVDADPLEAAQLFFSLDPQVTNEVLGSFKRRVWCLERTTETDHSGHRSERDWLLKVRIAANDLASKAGPIRSAQIRMAIKRDLGFLDQSDENVDDDGK
jgi:hypothetical protein